VQKNNFFNFIFAIFVLNCLIPPVENFIKKIYFFFLKELLTQKITPIIERRLVGSGTVIRAYKLKDGQKKKQPVAGIKVDWGKMDRFGNLEKKIFQNEIFLKEIYLAFCKKWKYNV